MKIQNNINNSTNFKAKLVVKVPVNNLKRLENIQHIFEENTSNNKKDVLYYLINPIVKSKYESVALNKRTDSLGIFFSDNLNNLMEKMSDNDIAQRLIRAYKCLKKEQIWNIDSKKIDDEIQNLSKSIKLNRARYNNSDILGTSKLTNMYKVIADRASKKLEHLQQVRKDKHEDFIRTITELASDDKDFADLVNENKFN